VIRAAPLLALLLAVPGGEPDPALTERDRRALAVLTAAVEGAGIHLHYDPATVPRATADAEAARAREALAALERLLEVRLDGPAHLFLYADAADFRARTGAPAAWGAFAEGPRSLHLPPGAPLRHELAHLLARRIPGAAERDPGGLWREGFAVALEGSEHGVPLAAWAATYRRVGLLPALGPLRERWPTGAPDGPNPALAAGAYVGWRIATEGLAAVKAVYGGRSPEGDREAAWHAALDGTEVGDAAADAVHRSLGLPEGRAPAALLDPARGEVLAAAPDLAGWRPGSRKAWAAAEGTIRGSAGEEWEFCAADREVRGPFALRAEVRVSAGASVALRCNRTAGGSDEAILAPDGIRVTVRGSADGLRSPARLVPGRWTSVLVTQEGGRARVHLDGRVVLDAPGAFGPGGGGAGLGVRGGTAEFRGLAILPPPE
jgi:hypothetical protein